MSEGSDQHWRDPQPSSGAGDKPPRSAAKTVWSGAAAAGRSVGRASRYAAHTARRAADAQGADESGLNRLIYLHALNAAGDAAVAISLAGSLFFQVPGSSEGGSSRQQVALFLGLTMLPFAIVAPLLGPFLDRFSHGRRWAIGATMAARVFLCWILADALSTESAAMFPAALGVLVCGKAYGVTRAAAIPRLLPVGFTLTKANGRISMAAIVGVAVSAPIAGILALVGSEWVLRYASLLFVLAVIASILLPAKVDSSYGEGTMTLRTSGRSERGRVLVRMPASVAFALRANCAPKWLYGFLLMFMAFLLQEHPVGNLSPTWSLALVAGGAGLGNLIGVVAASLLKGIKPQITCTAVVILDAVAAGFCALTYGVLSLALIGLVAGVGQSLAKFSLDSSIQRDVPEVVRTSAFARSDTTLQVAWVAGGFVGIALPLNATLGLWVACAVLAAWSVFTLAAPRPKGMPDIA
ncbi:MAG: MFS transporter [Nocardioides sp.]